MLNQALRFLPFHAQQQHGTCLQLFFVLPVPLPFFSFTGWKGSFYGDLHAYGKQGVRFFTETKTVTSRWFDDDALASVAPAGPNMTIQLK